MSLHEPTALQRVGEQSQLELPMRIQTLLAVCLAAWAFATPTLAASMKKKHHHAHAPAASENKQTPTGGQPGGGAGRS
jgi:hypothetical protein